MEEWRVLELVEIFLGERETRAGFGNRSENLAKCGKW
jgi:hypothetical protein